MGGKKKKRKSVSPGPPPSEPVAPASAAADAVEAPASTRLPKWLDRQVILGLAVPMVIAFVVMRRVKQFTVDDSYISFRYARNFARGLGLVYNEGERVEGYTNFLWTVLLGIGIKVGADPVVLSKLLGALCAFGAMLLLYRISARLRPYAAAPCVATWLFATSSSNMGYAVWGLETTLFVFLVLLGTHLFFREEEAFGGEQTEGEPTSRLQSIPWSGVAFGLAGLTRPEAPMYLGIVMLFLGSPRFFARRNLMRGAIFVAIVGAHLLFRHAYYGAWVPNTLGAKTGNLEGQLRGGQDYVHRWVTHTGPLWMFMVAGLVYALWKRQRALLALSALSVCIVAYVILVGGDWMQDFRFLVPFEPFAFLLVDVAARAGWDRLAKHARATVLVPISVAGAIAFGAWRARELGNMHRFVLATEDHFWKMAAGGSAKLFLENPPGLIAIGDIGYIGYATDYPVLDLLGLVDAKVAKMPGGYTQKIGKEWIDYFFERQPRYTIIISYKRDCQHPSVHGSVVMWNDPRFRQQYRLLTLQPLDNDFAWCIYERRDTRPVTPLPPSPASSSEAPRPE
jgi:hypothetical protein